MNKRNFLKYTLKFISIFSFMLIPLNTLSNNKQFKFKKFYKNHRNKIWILKSDDI